MSKSLVFLPFYATWRRRESKFSTITVLHYSAASRIAVRIYEENGSSLFSNSQSRYNNFTKYLHLFVTYHLFLWNVSGSKGESTPLLLVRSFFPNVDIGLESALKRRKDDSTTAQTMLHITVTKSCPGPAASSFMSSFMTAVSCWELLQQTEELRSEFAKICLHLRTETWLWLPSFIADGFLYQGLYAEALSKLQAAGPSLLNPQSVLLKSAGILFCMGNHTVRNFFSSLTMF